MTNTKPFIDSFMKAHQGRNERYSKPIQLEFDFSEKNVTPKPLRIHHEDPIIDPIDDPSAPFGEGCTEDPETCENQFLCICEEDMKRGGNGNESN